MVDVAFPTQYQQLRLYFDDIVKIDTYDRISKEDTDFDGTPKELSAFNSALKKGLEYNPKNKK